MDFLSMPGEDVHKLANLIWQSTALEDAGVDQLFSRVVEDAYTDTWLSEGGLADPLLTGQGTKAGDPLGDLMYNFLMAAARPRPLVGNPMGRSKVAFPWRREQVHFLLV